jgi:hypothetical protein
MLLLGDCKQCERPMQLMFVAANNFHILFILLLKTKRRLLTNCWRYL